MAGHKLPWKGWTQPSYMNWDQLLRNRQHVKIGDRAYRQRSSEKNASICVLGVKIMPMGPRRDDFGKERRPWSLEVMVRNLDVILNGMGDHWGFFAGVWPNLTHSDMITLASGWRIGCQRTRKEERKQVTYLIGPWLPRPFIRTPHYSGLVKKKEKKKKGENDSPVPDLKHSDGNFKKNQLQL